MPLLTEPRRPDEERDRPPHARRHRALTEVRKALAMIAADEAASRLGATGPLADWLYALWWCGPGMRADPTPVAPDEAARGAARLEAARRTSATSSADWLVLAAAGELLVAAQLRGDGRRLRTTSDAVVSSSRPGRPPRPGDLVDLVGGAGGLDPTGCWWWAHATGPEELIGSDLHRWYVHARDLSAAAELVPLLLEVARRAGCPLSLKCPPYERGYGRRDALVAYLPRRSSSAAERTLCRRAGALAALVDVDVPPLTRPLLPGVAVAEDPGLGDGGDGDVSYGQLRCGQVAAVAVRLGRSVTDDGPLTDDKLAAALADVGVGVDAVERIRR